MTWARQASILPSRFAMDMAVNNYYERHAAAVGASVAPVGRAWERALRAPGVVLHSSDGSHPNDSGTYLAACVFYATLTQASPVGLDSGGLNIAAPLRTQLQQVAWDTHQARQRAASPAIGHFPLSAGAVVHDLAPNQLVLGDLTGPDGTANAATQFGIGKYAGIPYFAGLNTAQLTVAFSAYRADWTAATTSTEMLIGKTWGYQLQQSGVSLEAKLYTTSGNLFPYLTHSVASLTPGWHDFALTYDGTHYSLWIDATKVTSAPATGDIRYYGTSPDRERYNAIAIGTQTVDTALSGETPSANFTGGLSNVRLFDRALSQGELQSL
jgi:hypothetical protein